MTKLEEARLFFAKDRFATENGAVIDEIGEHYAICSMEITPHHQNAAGRVMGGAVFMLADFAFAVASNFGNPPDVTATSQVTRNKFVERSKLTRNSDVSREILTLLFSISCCI